MKTQVYDRFGGGLLLLVMLTIAVVASEAQPDFEASSRAEDVVELDALPSVVDAAPDHPIRNEVSIEKAESNLPDNADPSHLPVQ